MIKSTRYAIKLKMGNILSTSVLIAERISFYAFSRNKELQFLKYGKQSLKLHRQMLIILVEDVTKLLSSEVKKRLDIQEGQGGEKDQFRSGVMDISPREPLKSNAESLMENLTIDWISDLEFLKRNLEMVRNNLGLT